MSISHVEQCTNCGACVSVCPQAAVSVQTDALFYRPSVDSARCTECGLCEKRCPVLHLPAARQPLSAFRAVHHDDEVIWQSSSGGVFSALAGDIKQRGGIVFGAAYSEDCRAVRFACDEEVGLDALRRSKYTESLTGEAFAQIRAALEQGREVLFCGAPCQAAGLRSYLNRDYPNLIVCDFICGGFPSHQMYEEYLTALEQQYHAPVQSVNFRPKTFGWREYAIHITFANGKEYSCQASLDPFFSAFLLHRWNIRENCLQCPFTDRHLSDLTLGDFWRSRSVTGEGDADKGVSLLLANTEKGKAAVSLLSSSMQIKDIPVNKVLYALKPHGTAAAYSDERRRFMEEYRRSGVVRAGKALAVVKGSAALKARVRGAQRKRAAAALRRQK